MTKCVLLQDRLVSKLDCEDDDKNQTAVFSNDGAEQTTICEVFFGSKDCYDSEQQKAYSRYYKQQCGQLMRMSGGRLPLDQHEDIILITKDIRAKLPRAEIKRKLLAKNGHQAPAPSDEQLDHAIGLVLRLFCMLDVGLWENMYSGRDCLTWTQGSKDDFLGGISVLQGNPSKKCDGVELEPHFTVKGLERIAGLKVHLKTNLADHFLLRTLALLFQSPRRGKGIKDWYKSKLVTEEDRDFTILTLKDPLRHIEEYKFWRDRLVELKETYDSEGPRTLMQWWYDRRDGIQWNALSIAVFFTVIFGLLQCRGRNPDL